jgi:hypothetical protein
MRQVPPTIADSIVNRPTTFQVGEHTLLVSKVMERRWTVAVDSRPVDGSYDTQADAWEAGVRAAHRLDVPPAG